MSGPTSLEAEIHQRRQSCGKRLQPAYAFLLEMLGCVLTNQLKTPHPYGTDLDLLGFDQLTKLFSLGGIGNQATLPDDKYVYRVFNRGSLPYVVNLKWPRYQTNPVLLWDVLMTRSHKGDLWVKLADYAENAYPANRGEARFKCTWWTTYPLDSDVILGAYTIGMFSEWINDEVYVMRAPVKNLNLLKVARVPTVIDAFIQPVFQPTQDPPPAKFGVTINLASHQNPTSGVNEFAIHPFEVEFIEIKPIKIEPALRQRYPEISKNDPDVLQSLISYYDAL